MLHPITGVPKGRVRWCGPSAIAALTGATYAQAIDIIKARRLARGRSPNAVMSTTTTEVREALGELGYSVVPLGFYRFAGEKPTLAQFLRKRPPELRNTALLVNVTHHWVAVQGKKIADSKHPEPVFTSDFAGRRKRVEAVWTVSLSPVLKPRSARTKAVNKATASLAKYKKQNALSMDQQGYRAWRKLQREHRFAYKIDRSDGPPPNYVEVTPFGPFRKPWITLHHGWSETARRLEDCLKDPGMVDSSGYYSE